MSDLNCYARYKKFGRAKYISHLDMVRFFNRAFRRGSIPIAYSEGFNPHPKMSFALPLPVFFESDCEMIIFTLAAPMESDILLSKLNSVMPEGLTLTEVVCGKPNIKTLSYARYRVSANLPSMDDIAFFLSLNEIIVPKKTKSGINDTNIREDINSITISDGKIEMVLAAGSRANLKPDVVINAMNKYISNYQSGSAEYLRLAILDDNLAVI